MEQWNKADGRSGLSSACHAKILFQHREGRHQAQHLFVEETRPQYGWSFGSMERFHRLAWLIIPPSLSACKNDRRSPNFQTLGRDAHPRHVSLVQRQDQQRRIGQVTRGPVQERKPQVGHRQHNWDEEDAGQRSQVWFWPAIRAIGNRKHRRCRGATRWESVPVLPEQRWDLFPQGQTHTWLVPHHF